MVEKEEITVAEAGRRGGTMTRDRHGVEFLREIAKRGGETTKKRYGHLFSEFGRRGGRPRRPVLEGGMGEESPQIKEADAVGPGDAPPA
jgi:general stress protein YciG